jgi:3-methyladenine DNA glycosylase AlkD
VADIDSQVHSALGWLKRHSSRAARDGMARFAIPADKALGVSMANVNLLGKQLGRSHELAAALWATDVYEARMLASLVDEPERVTSAQMDRWCSDFDNWAVVDTICFKLFDRAPHRWAKVELWSGKRGEFQKRAAFALLWALSRHDKDAGEASFARGLELIEQAAGDERNFVKKAVNMALRSVARRTPALHAQAVAIAKRLAQSPDPAPRWIGKDALREFARIRPPAAKR